jgi:hypothetical protein
MTFNMIFTGLPANYSQRVPESYDALDMQACGVLADLGCRFHVEGFGDPQWPVDVAYYFSTVMEQLPQALAGINAHRAVDLDFYGQGIERALTFQPREKTVVINCSSRTSWRPEPATETASVDELKLMLTTLVEDFIRALSLAFPELPDALRRHPLPGYLPGCTP